MSRAAIVPLTWLFGAALVVAIVRYTGWTELLSAVSLVTTTEIVLWILITIVMRAVLVVALTLPLRALGHSVSGLQAFWLGWLRSFFNQVIPLSGLAYYSIYLSRKGLTLGEVAALGSPQFVLAAFSVGATGLIAASSLAFDIPAALLVAFSAVAATSLVLLMYSDKWIANKWIASLHGRAGRTLRTTRLALACFKSYGLVRSLIAIHLIAILLRSARLFLLFAVIAPGTSFSTVLVLSCVGEIALLFQLTPGGIGVREGTIIAGAVMMDIDTAATAAVAVADRALMIAVVCSMAPWAVWQLNRPAFASSTSRMEARPEQ